MTKAVDIQTFAPALPKSPVQPGRRICWITQWQQPNQWTLTLWDGEETAQTTNTLAAVLAAEFRDMTDGRMPEHFFVPADVSDRVCAEIARIREERQDLNFPHFKNFCVRREAL